jgi:acetylornithine deacetylase
LSPKKTKLTVFFIKKGKMKEKELLIKLIEIPSISDNELTICDYIFDLLQNMSFDMVEKIPVDQNGYNILAKKGESKVMLQAHLDVVPPYIPVSEKEGKIYGRGSCDTKASISSMICAAEKALESGISNFALLFTVGEEKDFRGAKAFVDDKKSWPFAVVGEPTCLQVKNGQYGLLNIELKTKGQRAHSSVPEKGDNAIDRLLPIINELKKIKLGKGTSNNLTVIKGGSQDNIIPGEATALFNLRINPEDKNDYLALFQEIAYKYEKTRLEKGLDLPAILNKLPAELNFLGKTNFVKGGTELSFLKDGIILGPGDMDLAHSDGEFVEIADLRKASQIYLKIIKAMNK